jgi:hypothetical protein
LAGLPTSTVPVQPLLGFRLQFLFSSIPIPFTWLHLRF